MMRTVASAELHSMAAAQTVKFLETTAHCRSSSSARCAGRSGSSKRETHHERPRPAAQESCLQAGRGLGR
ncbi:hypothetical protein AOLI_G00003910 [Acnodon oligacanthus]